MGMQQNWQRRLAIQIVSQLPEGTEDSLMVLGFARELVEGFLAAKAHNPRLPEEPSRRALSVSSNSNLKVPGNVSHLPR